ncbi:GAF domain-containing protein [Streptomyces sp. NPDC001985]|uniref:GAF domain-containing protein n=1 Tax=Streptomyces sp. NPDC001985 TaxID=3154406 RepID=UPI00332E5913
MSEPGGPAEPEPRLPVLLEAFLGVGTDLELPGTLQQIVDTATELAGARRGALGVVDPEHGVLTELFTSGLGEAERDRIGREALGRAPGSAAGLIGLLSPTPEPGAGAGGGVRSLLGVEIRVDTEVFGTLYLVGKRSGSFTDEDLAVLRVLGSRAGIAIGNARLYERARQRERWIAGAAAVTTALLTGESAEDALMTVAEQARILARATAGVVLQPTDEGGMEIVAASTARDSTDSTGADRADGPGGPEEGSEEQEEQEKQEEDIVGTTIAPGSPVLVQLLGGEPVFIDDSATDPRMTTPVRTRFGPSMMLPLQSGGRLIGTLALPRGRHGRPYTAEERLLATQFASQAALALVLADAQHNREQLAVYEDRDRIARDLHDLVVQRLFATEMMLESTRRRAAGDDSDELLGRAVDELDSTIQEVRTAIFALQQPPAEVPTSFRGRVLRETAGASALLGFRPSVRFRGAVDALVREPVDGQLLAALRAALAAAHRRADVTSVEVDIDAAARLPDGRTGIRLVVTDNGRPEPGGTDGTAGTDGTDDTAGADGAGRPGRTGTTVTWEAPR